MDKSITKKKIVAKKGLKQGKKGVFIGFATVTTEIYIQSFLLHQKLCTRIKKEYGLNYGSVEILHLLYNGYLNATEKSISAIHIELGYGSWKSVQYRMLELEKRELVKRRVIAKGWLLWQATDKALSYILPLKK